MASFVIHTIAAEQLLKKLESEYGTHLSQENTNKFLLGNLIVDSLKLDMTIPPNLQGEELIEYKMNLKRKNRQEKVSTHFRNPDNEENILKLPEISLFLSKYRSLLSQDISVVGYLFHLYTARYFFSTLFPKTFISLKSDGTIATREKDSHTIRILKSNQIVSDKMFWTGTSPLSVYSDYTLLNKILLEHFGTNFNSNDLIEFAEDKFINPGIEEVDYSKIIGIISTTQKYIEESYQISQTNLNVFDEELVKDFIHEVVKQFFNEYGVLFNIFFSKPGKKLIK